MLVAQTTQPPIQIPKRFEIYYELGLQNGPPHYDSFDSEKKERVFDAQGGQIKYKAELSDAEKTKIYEAVLKNNLLAIGNVFSDLGNRVLEPAVAGRFRIDIDGQIKETLFHPAFPRFNPGNTEWTRLRSVLDVVESILNSKDRQQPLPPHYRAL